MAITEAYMDAGDFTISMKVDTRHLMGQIYRGGWIAITPQAIGDPALYDLPDLLAAARYTGIVVDTNWDDGILTLEGNGLDLLLGNRQRIGWPSPSVSFSNDELTTIIALISSGGIIPPIFTIGNVTNGANHTGSHDNTETVKDVITTVMEDCAGHYRINPDCSIDASPVTSDAVYRNNPNTVFLADGWGADALWTGLPVQSLKTRISMREWLSDVDPTLYGPLGSTQLQRADVGDTEPVGGIAETMTIRTRFTEVTGKGSGLGDVVYLHQHGNGLAGDTPIVFRGELLNPIAHRIHETEWDLVDGMGLYYWPNQASVTTSDVIDLSDVVKTTPLDQASTFLRTLDVSLEAPACS